MFKDFSREAGAISKLNGICRGDGAGFGGGRLKVGVQRSEGGSGTGSWEQVGL